MHALATGSQPPYASKTSEPAQVLGFLRIAGSLHARVDEALAAVGLSYREYRLLESLEGSPSDDVGGWSGSAATRAETLAALARHGLVSRVGRAPGTGGTALTSRGSQTLRVARARVRCVARDFAAAIGVTEARGLMCLLARVDGHRRERSGHGVVWRA